MDMNKDGIISLEEYTKLCEACNMTAEVAKMMFDMIDKNHDGKLELKEVLAITNKFWFDRNDVMLTQMQPAELLMS